MDYNLLSNLEYCKEIVDSMTSFILYSHVPSAIVALIVSGFILWKARTLAGRVLFALAIIFSIWVVLDLSIWLRYDYSSLLMAAWSMLGLLSALMFVLVFYFAYVLAFEKNMPAWVFVIWTVILAPVITFSATNWNLIGYDIRDCVAVENTLYTNYYYGIGILVFLLLPVVGYLGWKNRTDVSRRGIPMAIAGAELFLLAFFSTGILAQYLVENEYISDFGLEQYGIVAMAVFMAFLAYIIVQYQTFRIKLIATQALVFAIILLVAAEFVFVETSTNYALVAVTLALASASGFLLVKSVKREIEQREHIEQLAGELQLTNERQETLIHFIGHEVKGFLTKDAGAFAAIVDGDFGNCSPEMVPFVKHALNESRQGAASVGNILKASNLKKGAVTFTKAPFDLAALVAEVVQEAKPAAEKKGLSLNLIVEPSGTPYMLNGDKENIGDHVLRNLIDNSINYTPSGHIDVLLKKENGKVVFAVKDTGVGISEEDKKRLFTEGGHGKESQKINVHSTGYGLFISKNIVAAHGGAVRAESDGPGKGSTFFAEFPV